MAGKRKGLGRGLDALLSATPAKTETKAQPDAPAAAPKPAATQTRPVEDLKRGRYQPRVDMRQDSLTELAASIKAQGLIQPIVVRTLKNPIQGGPGFEIIAGERRWRAAQLAGLADVPVVIREVDDEAAMAMALIENIQREDLNPMEEAEALNRLIAEFDLTHEEAGQAVGRSREAVSNLIRLSELGPDVQALLRSRRLSMGHARALLGVENPAEQLRLANKVVNEKLSVRVTEKLVRGLKAPSARKKRPATLDPDIQRLQSQLSETLGARVKVTPGEKGAGKLEISYHSLDELEGILDHIK